MEVEDQDALECVADGKEVEEPHGSSTNGQSTKDPGDAQQREERQSRTDAFLQRLEAVRYQAKEHKAT